MGQEENGVSKFTTKDVVVSAVVSKGTERPEVKMFPSDNISKIITHTHIEACFDTLDHEEALVKSGYSII